MEKYNKEDVEKVILKMMDFEEALNIILEDNNIKPVYFPFEKLNK
jgi:LPS sulfotransferase NodH